MQLRLMREVFSNKNDIISFNDIFPHEPPLQEYEHGLVSITYER